MRVGYVLRYWPARSETFVAREIAALEQLDIHVDVVSLGARADGEGLDDRQAQRPPKLPLSALAALGRHEARTAARWLGRHQAPKHVLRALWVAELAAKYRWERVHAHFGGEAAEVALTVSRILSIPFSVTVHAVDLFVPRKAFATLVREASPCITVCEHHRDTISDGYGVDAVVVPCGVPLEVPRAHPGGTGARFVSVARDVPKKGLNDVVSAVLAVPGASLRLVSDAHRLGGPRVAVGPLHPDAVAGVLAKAHVFALACRIAPSGDRDGLPVALLEAMAAGLPVVTTAVAGIPEVIDEDVGWLVRPGDAVAFAAAVAAAASDPDARARRGAAGRMRLQGLGRTVAHQATGVVQAWASANRVRG